MPYIKPSARDKVDKQIEALFKSSDGSMGQLNYIITKLLLLGEPASYDDFNSLVGVLECAKMEFYRRKVALYEASKKEENGDVYGNH